MQRNGPSCCWPINSSSTNLRGPFRRTTFFFFCWFFAPEFLEWTPWWDFNLLILVSECLLWVFISWWLGFLLATWWTAGTDTMLHNGHSFGSCATFWGLWSTARFTLISSGEFPMKRWSLMIKFKLYFFFSFSKLCNNSSSSNTTTNSTATLAQTTRSASATTTAQPLPSQAMHRRLLPQRHLHVTSQVATTAVQSTSTVIHFQSGRYSPSVHFWHLGLHRQLRLQLNSSSLCHRETFKNLLFFSSLIFFCRILYSFFSKCKIRNYILLQYAQKNG